MSIQEGVKPYDEMTVIEKLQNALKPGGHLHPGGTLQVSRLHMNNSYFEFEFVKACVAELEKLPLRAALGEPPTNLEKLAYMLLCDSAYIELHERKD